MSTPADFVSISHPAPHWRFTACAALLGFLLACALPVLAQDAPPPPSPPAAAPPPQADTPNGATVELQVEASDEARHHRHRGGEDTILRFNKDTQLAASDSVDSVVTIAGSSITAGQVRDTVVSIFGDTRVTGEVGQDAIALFGNAYVNSTVGGDVVAFLGDVELGPLARIDGDLVVISGALTRDPAASVRGDVQEVGLPFDFGRFEWLRPWVKHCLLLGRPLALEPGLGWAWTLAFGFLALYVVLALLFSNAVERCATTIEQRPGQTVVAALLSVLLIPILSVLLAITILGFAIIPFLWLGVFVVGIFGHAVVLAALGRRITRIAGSSAVSDVALAVFVGGLVMIGLYLIPVIGFIAYKALGILGVGVVVYTLLLDAQAKRENVRASAAAASAAPAAADLDAGTGTLGPDPALASTESATNATPAAAPSDLNLPRAGFWIRMGALFIDMILVGVALAVLNSDGVFVLALVIYGAVMWKLKGTTVGGIVCNLKVVRVDGREVDWTTAVIRGLSCFLSLAFVGLGFVWIAFDPNRQAWHDKIAGTLVVRMPQGVSLV